MRWLLIAAMGLVACGGGESEPLPVINNDTGAVESSIDDSASEDAAVDTGTIIEDTAIDTFVVSDTGAPPDTYVSDTYVSDTPVTIGSGFTPLAAAPTGLAGRRSHSAVWSGTSMIVWGGCAAAEKPNYGDGASYDPATNSWKMIKDAGLAPRYLHAAAWSGTEMLIIGGILSSASGGYNVAKDGALYDPATDSVPEREPRGVTASS